MKLASSRRRLLRGISALSAASACLFPGSARADGAGVGGGVYASFVFGDRLGVGWGAEGFVLPVFTGRARGCDARPRAGLGGTLQLGAIGLETLSVVLAMQGGGEIDSRGGFAPLGEFGITARAFEGAGLGIHTGLVVATPLLLDVFLREEWLLDSYSVGHRVRAPAPFGDLGSCVEGRPLRDDAGLVALPGAATGDPRWTPDVDCEDASALAAAWADDAQAECASVPAFQQLAADLLALGAPDSLVARAIGAGFDELGHALACARLAQRYSGRPTHPRSPSVAPRAPMLGLPGLTRLALESWIDGCLGEGAAAARAREAARTASDDQARGVRAAIATEEREHAELAWDVLRWALQRGGAIVADAVCAHRGAELSAPAPAPAPDGWERHGRVAPLRAAAIDAELAARSRGRLDRLLSDRSLGA